jgi:hypothetical protein
MVPLEGSYNRQIFIAGYQFVERDRERERGGREFSPSTVFNRVRITQSV